MLLVDGQEGSLELDSVLATGISGARKLGLHRLGDAKLEIPAFPISHEESDLGTPSHIRTEIGIRIWYVKIAQKSEALPSLTGLNRWALVLRDWSRGQALGYYTIQPSHFNIRMPLHINDDDLEVAGSADKAHITERPRSQFTMLSYTIHALEIAGLVRESIDLHNSMCDAPRLSSENSRSLKTLNEKYEKFVAGLPPHFGLGSTVGLTSTGPLAAVPVHQWMLHQQLWGLFLRLYQTGLSSTDSRESCQLLAQNIISSHAQVQTRCVVCGSLSIGDAQLFNAAAVLVICLLFGSRPGNVDSSGVQLSRLMMRDKIREAIELLRRRGDASYSEIVSNPRHTRARAFNKSGVIALEALTKLEEGNEDYGECEGPRTGRETAGNQGVILKDKVLDILAGLSQSTTDSTAGEPTFDTPDDFGLSTTLTPEPFPRDLDVLPVLSNDPSCDFWQYLDFTPDDTPSDDLFPGSTGQTLINSVSFTPSSDITLSLGDGGLPELNGRHETALCNDGTGDFSVLLEDDHTSTDENDLA